MKEPGAHAQHQAVLAELTQFVLEGIDLPSLRLQVVRCVARSLAADYVGLWETLHGDGPPALRATAGYAADAGERAPSQADASSFACAALLSARPLLVASWNDERRLSLPAALRERGVRWSIGTRIQGQLGAFGVLEAHCAGQRAPGAEGAAFLQAVANILAMAAKQAQLVAAAQDKAVWEERQRLSRDLHDSVTQALYGVTLHAQAARRLLAAGELDTAQRSLRTLQETAQEALDEMRLLIFELRPPILEQDGLVAALQARLEAVEGRVNLQTKLLVEGVERLPAPVEQPLYRIAQEALNNALKHAGAQHIGVSLRQALGRVTLEISDDGRGFDTLAAPSAGGMGLRGIAERVAQLGGGLTVRSAPGAGTVLRVEVRV